MTGQAQVVALAPASPEADLLYELVCLWCERAEKRAEFGGGARLAALEEHFLERAENWQRVFTQYRYDAYEKRLLLLAYTCDHDMLAFARLARLREEWRLQGRAGTYIAVLGYTATERHRYRATLERQQKEHTVLRVGRGDDSENLTLAVDYDALLPLLTGECLERRQVLQEEENTQPLAAVVLNRKGQEQVAAFLAQYRQLKERAEKMRAQGITYGTAPLLLLHGLPGTGKTMLARGLATELGVPLLTIRRDARQRVEKRGDGHGYLYAALQEAAARNGLLYIDECDDLFAEGSEASREFLIACEQHEALVVLSTNNRARLDPALLRRMLVSIEFDLPQAQQRTEIWRRHLAAAGMTMPAGTTAEELGKWYQMPGGYIKNAVLLCGGAVDAAALHRKARNNLAEFLRAHRLQLGIFTPRREAESVRFTEATRRHLARAREACRQYARLLAAGCEEVRALTIVLLVNPFERQVSDAAVAEIMRGSERPLLTWSAQRKKDDADFVTERDMFLLHNACWTLFRHSLPLPTQTKKDVNEYNFATMFNNTVRIIPIATLRELDDSLGTRIDLLVEVEADNSIYQRTLAAYQPLLQMSEAERTEALRRLAASLNGRTSDEVLGNAIVCCKAADPSLRGLELLDAALADLKRRRNLQRPLFGG